MNATNATNTSGNTFLEKFQEYVKEFCDAPSLHITMMGYLTLATTIGQAMYYRHGHRKFYPNLWVFLIGPSTRTRKSTMLSVSQSLLRKVDPKLSLPNDYTPEALLEQLSLTPQGCFFHSEFITFSENLERSYMAGTKGLLMDLYDCPSEYTKARKGKEYVVKDVTINMGLASTKELFKKRSTELDLESGWYARFLFCPAEPNGTVIQLPPPDDDDKRNRLVEELRNLRTLLGESHEVRFTESQKARYITWADRYDARWCKPSPYISIFRRLKEYLFKFFLLNMVNRCEFGKQGSDASLEESCLLVDVLARQVNEFSGQLVMDEHGHDVEKILGLLSQERFGKLSRTALTRATRWDPVHLDRVLRTLKDGDWIEQEEKPVGESRRDTNWICLKNDAGYVRQEGTQER